MMSRVLLCVVACAAALHAQVAERDTFQFRDGASRILNVTLDDENGTMVMTWPDKAGGWDTALLGVDVASRVPVPFVEIAAAGRSDRQYFSPEDNGRRWINLSFLRGAVTA